MQSEAAIVILPSMACAPYGVRASTARVFLKIYVVLCVLGAPQKDAGRKTMKIGGSGVPRTLTGSRMVTKRIKYVSCICVAQ